MGGMKGAKPKAVEAVEVAQEEDTPPRLVWILISASGKYGDIEVEKRRKRGLDGKRVLERTNSCCGSRGIFRPSSQRRKY
jgi:hypothetical protein